MSEVIGRRRLAAILVADVVGYSRLMEADEAGTLSALKERRKTILEPVVKEHGGRIVKLMGDGALIEFASAVSAVKGAVVLQRRMAEANAAVSEERRIVLRIGINLGDVIGEGCDIYGEGVNIAARLEAMAEPGGICISEKVHNEVRGKIDTAMSDLGPMQLKNIATPVRAFGVSADERAGQVGSSRAVAGSKEFTSIAVLPFTNMSGSAEQDYFADGITEDIITELSRSKNLAVVARNTTFTYKGRSVNVAELGRQLGADFVVEGSIRLAANRVRATVQLIDAQTGAHVFAEKFDREMADIFAVQDDIVEAIVGRLFYNLQDAAAVVREKNPTTSISAYTFWLRGQAAYRSGDERRGREHWHESIRIDPTYARALASLSRYYAFARFSEPSAQTDAEFEQQSRQFAARAIVADKNDPFVLARVAVSLSLLGEVEGALRYSDMAFSLSPRDLSVLASRSCVVTYAGRHEEGLALIERVCRAEPLVPPPITSCLGECFYFLRRFDAALAAFKSLIDAPYYIRQGEAACLAQLGRLDEARRIVQAMPAAFDTTIHAKNIAKMCALPDDKELWLDGFRKAGVPI